MTQLTRNELVNLPAESRDKITYVYYKAAEGIMGLLDESHLLGVHEQEAIEKLRLAFAKLDHIGASL